MTKIEIDVIATANLQEFLLTLEGHAGRIVRFEAEGPAGGNPCFVLEFGSDEAAMAYMDDIGLDRINFDVAVVA
jgi:hypothetical protein